MVRARREAERVEQDDEVDVESAVSIITIRKRGCVLMMHNSCLAKHQTYQSRGPIL